MYSKFLLIKFRSQYYELIILFQSLQAVSTIFYHMLLIVILYESDISIGPI